MDEQDSRRCRCARKPSALAAHWWRGSRYYTSQVAVGWLESRCGLADKGYDADALIDSIQVAGATAVIPPRRNRVVQRSYDRHLYKERNLVERFFNRIK